MDLATITVDFSFLMQGVEYARESMLVYSSTDLPAIQD